MSGSNIQHQTVCYSTNTGFVNSLRKKSSPLDYALMLAFSAQTCAFKTSPDKLTIWAASACTWSVAIKGAKGKHTDHTNTVVLLSPVEVCAEVRTEINTETSWWFMNVTISMNSLMFMHGKLWYIQADPYSVGIALSKMQCTCICVCAVCVYVCPL